MTKYIRTHAVIVVLTLLIVFAMSETVLAQNNSGKKPPTFSKEVIRIFQNRCQICHHTGNPFTPMPLEKYREVRPWAKSIQKKVVTKEMPPWHAKPSAEEFTNDISITQDEIDTISQWVAARAPQGNSADLPPGMVFDDGWQIGEPDVILDMGVDFEIPASGSLPLQQFQIDTEFKEDKWLSGIEVLPGNYDAVRQISVYVQNPKEGLRIPDGGTLGNGMLGVYSPGAMSRTYKIGEGKLVKPGAKIIFQILYTTNGTATTDRSRVGLRFHQEPVKRHIITRGIGETRFEIPPHNPAFPIYATYTFDEPVTLISMRPLMHYRGQNFKFIVHYPDGLDKILLEVDRYNFNWQSYYYPKVPITLPKGTVLECIAIMNNSHENYLNPQPHDAVRFGEQPLDEKMIGWIEYTLDDESLTPDIK